ncbi:MAG: ATP-binding cassette domain-containing protein [Planctomycetota bacterium]|jgi:molybdate transport system ATP-binding protein|nr:ATP-binding cassette domain-containing protein [Planctomycetota bacterium]
MTLEVHIDKRLGRDFSLEISFVLNGGCLGILGASGCGKSLTLKCVAGIERPDCGRIVLDGVVLFDSEKGINLPPQKRGVGYLFQNNALFPRLTAGENIRLAMPKTGDREERAAGLLERFRLGGLDGRLPRQLSGGQQQRVALARMLAANPRIILLDEPFSALDHHLRENMRLRLGELLRLQGDAIMVSHSRDDVYQLCGRLLTLDGGRVLGHGETRAVFHRPGRVEVARLTGCKNISPARVLSERRLLALDWDWELTTEEQIPPGTKFVGIRAHDFAPVREECPGGGNLVEMAVRERSEEPFEWCVVFANARAAPGPDRATLWWKCSKHAVADPPRFLRVDPAAVMPLAE